MKYYIIATALCACTLFACQKKKLENIKIVGSETVKPLAEAVKTKYLNVNDANCTITIDGGGSGKGISSLINGEADIAMASRPMKMEEIEMLASKKSILKECIIALDDIMIIVNTQNPLSKITTDQLRKIYTDSITNWKELMGTNLPITYLTRKEGSGTLQYFKENVLKGAALGKKPIQMDGMKEIIDFVSANSNAIGFIGSGHQTDRIKTLEVSKDGGVNYYAPTERNVRAMYYPFVTPLYFYYLDEDENNLSEIDKFVNYAQSKSGRYLITDLGFVPHVDKED